ncbi:hypothetical protein K9K85_03030 [Patescibacteria group bacterium]|nr:hypothetical protein [Patescibacteria group bacterium]
MSSSHQTLKAIYLYIFSLVGLVLLIIGSVRLLDMGLKAFVFKQAEEQDRINYSRPSLSYPVDYLQKVEERGDEELSDEEKKAITSIVESYQDWEEKSSQIDPLTSRRHREASVSLALILIGLPLYAYHWKSTKKL